MQNSGSGLTRSAIYCATSKGRPAYGQSISACATMEMLVRTAVTMETAIEVV